ncbi:MAG TPA: replication-relaxation family protein [Solirubrobacteraceae bacterium]|jgi:hypothetical protein|nr:replication-relaxation family protein [Solirubrobacteraceae bacterium]
MERVSRRGRVSDAQLTGLAAHLTERDRQIARDCYEHRVFTTRQLERLHFSDPRAGRRRLLTLYRLRVLDRFRPRLPLGDGSAPYHWVLDEAGAQIVAAQQGIDRQQLRYSHTAALSVADSAKLAHHIEVNDLFTRLARDAAQAGGALAEWYGERTMHSILHAITPDGYGVLRLPDASPIHLLLELDRATEPAARLREKARRYARSIPRSTLRQANPLILLAVPSVARARTATAAVANTGAPIAVTVWSAASTGSVFAIVTEAAGTTSRVPLSAPR